MTTLAEAFTQEQARLRVLLRTYREIGPAGAFGGAMIEMSLRHVDHAAMSGDPVAMLRALEDMKGFTG